jgi:hypothetical protein
LKSPRHQDGESKNIIDLFSLVDKDSRAAIGRSNQKERLNSGNNDEGKAEKKLCCLLGLKKYFAVLNNHVE